MSQIEELISTLCPDGVEYKKLGDISTDIFRGAGITREQVTEEGTPCVRYGEIYTTYGIYFDTCVSHTDESTVQSKKYFEYGDILFAITGESVEDIAKSTAYVGNEKCLAGGDIVVLKHNQNPKYLSYALSTTAAQAQKSKGKVKSKVVHSSVPAIKEIIIPVPPLEVQAEIVRILDEYSESVTALQQELESELTARRKQYEYYRDELLSFGSDCEWRTLEEVAGIYDCPHSSPKWKEQGIPVIRNYNLKCGHIDSSRLSYVDETDYAERTKRVVPQKDDVLFSREAPIGNIGLIPEGFQCCQGQRIVLLRFNKNIVPRFIVHLFQSNLIKKQYQMIQGQGATVSNFGIGDLRKLRIPVPSINEQERLASILDRFDILCNGITEGLPAEIEARRKQYEYYRDKLLSFEEVRT